MRSKPRAGCTKEEARARLANKIEDDMKLPVAIAIAHHLIRDWAKAEPAAIPQNVAQDFGR